MKILIIAQNFPPDITAASFRIHDTAKLLSEKNEVRVITAIPHRAQAENQKTEDFDSGPFKVYRSKIIRSGSGGMVKYLVHYLSFMSSSIWTGLKIKFKRWKPDIIWASSPPLFVGFSGLFLSKLFRCPLVLDIRDIWPDSAVSAGQISSTGFAYRTGKKMERFLYNRANHITCVAEPMRRYIAENTSTPMSVVYNGVSKHSNGKCPAKLSYKVNGEKTILYAGNFGRVQQLDLLINAYAELIEEDYLKDWHIRLVGAGAMTDSLQSLISQRHLQDRVTIVPPVERRLAMQQAEAADLLFISLLPDKVLAMTIPSKVFDCMLAGKPILAGILGQGKDILESTNSNVCYCPGDLTELKKALIKVAEQYPRLKAAANKNKKTVLDKYTRQTAVSTLSNALEHTYKCCKN